MIRGVLHWNTSLSPTLPLNTFLLLTDASSRLKPKVRANKCSINKTPTSVISNPSCIAFACAGQELQNKHQWCYHTANTALFSELFLHYRSSKQAHLQKCRRLMQTKTRNVFSHENSCKSSHLMSHEWIQSNIKINALPMYLYLGITPGYATDPIWPLQCSGYTLIMDFRVRATRLGVFHQ